MTDEISPEEAVALEASKPGKFSLIERLRGRNMPTETVVIYLDEAAAYELNKAKAEHSTMLDRERLAGLDAKIDELIQRVKDSAVTIHMRAVSNIRYDELIKEVEEVYPVEYEVATNPFTGRQTRGAKANPDRDEYFNDLYLSEVIEKAEFDGSVDDEIDVKWVQEFKSFAPLDALRVVAEKAFSLRMVSDWMDEIQNEDFSPKP